MNAQKQKNNIRRMFSRRGLWTRNPLLPDREATPEAATSDAENEEAAENGDHPRDMATVSSARRAFSIDTRFRLNFRLTTARALRRAVLLKSTADQTPFSCAIEITKVIVFGRTATQL